MSDTVHIEGLLHLATIAFAMTLAYLGLDKVGDGRRVRLEAQIAAKARDIAAVLIREDTIQRDGTLNRLHAIVGDGEDRKAICMLLALARDIPHDLYRGARGWMKKKWHTLELFVSFKCFLQHWDLKVIRKACVLSGVIFFGLVYLATFGPPLHWLVACVVLTIDVLVVLLVIWAAHGVATAKTRLEKKYKKWWGSYVRWLANLKETRMTQAEAAALTPITPKG